MNNRTEKPRPSGVSRRTVVKGAAWAVPAITVASAVPAMAASATVTVSEAGDACKLPGNSCSNAGYSKGYLQPLTICSRSPYIVTVTITTPATLEFNGVPTVFTPVPASFTLPAATAAQPQVCQRVILNLNLQDNSQNSSIYGTLYWTFVSRRADGTIVETGSGTTAISTAATAPCSNCTV